MANQGVTYHTVQFDSYPPLELVVHDRDGPVNLTGATSVAIVVVFPAGVKSFTATKDPDQVANTGKVSFTPAADDIEEAGEWRMRTVVTWPGPKTETFPNDTYDWLHVMEAWTTA